MSSTTITRPVESVAASMSLSAPDSRNMLETTTTNGSTPNANGNHTNNDEAKSSSPTTPPNGRIIPTNQIHNNNTTNPTHKTRHYTTSMAPPSFPSPTATTTTTTAPSTPTSQRYNHIHSLLMSNLEEMKAQFVNAQKKMRNHKLDEASPALHHKTLVVQQKELLGQLHHQQQQESNNNDITHQNHQKIQPRHLDVTAAVTSPTTPPKLSPSQEKPASSSPLPSSHQHNNELQRIKQRNQELELQNSELRSRISTLESAAAEKDAETVAAAESSPPSDDSSEQLRKMTQMLQEANQRVQHLEEQLQELKREPASKVSASTSAVPSVLHKEVQLHKSTADKECHTTLPSESVPSQSQHPSQDINPVDNSPKPQTETRSSQFSASSTQNGVNESASSKSESTTLQESASTSLAASTEHLQTQVNVLSEENSNLFDMIRSYETLLETIAQKVSHSQENVRQNHVHKVHSLERKIETLQEEMRSTHKENQTLQAKLDMAIQTLKEAYWMGCSEISTHNEELPLYIEENSVLRQLVHERQLELVGGK